MRRCKAALVDFLPERWYNRAQKNTALMPKQEASMTFGEKLQYLRKEQNWTQKQLADQIGISRQSLSKWELGVSLR